MSPFNDIYKLTSLLLAILVMTACSGDVPGMPPYVPATDRNDYGIFSFCDIDKAKMSISVRKMAHSEGLEDLTLFYIDDEWTQLKVELRYDSVAPKIVTATIGKIGCKKVSKDWVFLYPETIFLEDGTELKEENFLNGKMGCFLMNLSEGKVTRASGAENIRYWSVDVNNPVIINDQILGGSPQNAYYEVYSMSDNSFKDYVIQPLPQWTHGANGPLIVRPNTISFFPAEDGRCWIVRNVTNTGEIWNAPYDDYCVNLLRADLSPYPKIFITGQNNCVVLTSDNYFLMFNEIVDYLHGEYAFLTMVSVPLVDLTRTDEGNSISLTKTLEEWMECETSISPRFDRYDAKDYILLHPSSTATIRKYNKADGSITDAGVSIPATFLLWNNLEIGGKLWGFNESTVERSQLLPTGYDFSSIDEIWWLDPETLERGYVSMSQALSFNRPLNTYELLLQTDRRNMTLYVISKEGDIASVDYRTGKITTEITAEDLIVDSILSLTVF